MATAKPERVDTELMTNTYIGIRQQEQKLSQAVEAIKTQTRKMNDDHEQGILAGATGDIIADNFAEIGKAISADIMPAIQAGRKALDDALGAYGAANRAVKAAVGDQKASTKAQAAKAEAARQGN